MASDTDLEERLRGALIDHAGADGLPEHVLVDALTLGRTSVRRRRRLVTAGSVAAVALVAGIAVALVDHDGPQPQPAPPAPSPSPSSSPSSSTSAEPVGRTAAGTWAASLPRGGPPDVPYLSGTTLVEPDGSRIQVPGTEASFVGMSVTGPVLLVGTEVQDPYSFSTRYVLVRSNGEVVDLPASTITAGDAEEALISPDGTQLATGGGILDLTDLSVVGQVPAAAKILVAWTPVGIVYFVDGGHYVLWPVGGEPITLQSNPGVFATGSDVAIDQCGTITRLAADGTLSTISAHCVLGSWSVSPTGTWVLAADWHLVDVATGEERNLADRDLVNADRADDVWWDGDKAVTIPAGEYLVRCRTDTARCERVAGPEEGLTAP